MITAITGYPRSRTCWLATYFDTLPGVRAFHDPLRHTDCTTEGLKRFVAERASSYDHVVLVDHAFLLFPELLRYCDRTFFVQRNRFDVETSLLRTSGSIPYALLDAEQKEIERRLYEPDFTVPFERIDASLRDIHDHCVPGVRYDPRHAADMIDRVITVKPEYLQRDPLPQALAALRRRGVVGE